MFDSEVGSSLANWILQYGSLALFFLLAFGILGIPFPEESILVFCGWLLAHNKLLMAPTITSALIGSMTGITLSYLIGKTAARYLMIKYGYWIGLTHRRVTRAEKWFKRSGKWLLLIGYFIPLIRHLTGYAAGSSKLDYKQFALFAYSGAALWSMTFLSLGYFFGKKIYPLTV